jgi:hypothetical protein
MGIYGHVFFHLRDRLHSVINNDTSKLSRATKFMVMYPATYVLLTLPIAIGRMVAMAGVEMPSMFFCIAGSFLTSCGWVDALLYTMTRRIFVNGDLSNNQYSRNNGTGPTTHGAHHGDVNLFSLQSMHKDVGGRTVTIVGGANRMSRALGKTPHTNQSRTLSKRDHSPSGSQDSIIKDGVIGVYTETNILVESADGEDSIKADSVDLRHHSEGEVRTTSI